MLKHVKHFTKGFPQQCLNPGNVKNVKNVKSYWKDWGGGGESTPSPPPQKHAFSSIKKCFKPRGDVKKVKKCYKRVPKKGLKIREMLKMFKMLKFLERLWVVGSDLPRNF